MDQYKVGKLISELRKKNGMTQKDLADKLNVSDKTISKWECNIGFPDVTMLKEICNIFKISTDELLSGEITNVDSIKNRKYIWFILPFILIIIIIVFALTLNHQEKTDIIVDHSCVVTRIYYIDNIGKSYDDNYLYITVHEPNVEGTFTMKLSKLIGSRLEVGKKFEFTFKTDKKHVVSVTDVLFKNSEVINLNLSEKNDKDIVRDSYCN